MANPAPTINQINAFNATQGTTIDFNIIGGTELVRSNRIYIYDLSDNSLICTHLYVSTESIHELPANTDSSMVYESGKSSADFVNGKQYYAQIQTFTDIGGTEGGSGLSVAKMFWCLVDPSLTISTIPSTISTTSYNVSATYNANTSVVSNIIQQYQFSLYSATGSLLQSSGVVVGNGEQQGTSTAYDISYNFSGLGVGSSYYVVVDVTTTQGMNVSTQSNTFTVSIDTPTLGEATVVNNACDGYISVTSNLSSEYGGSASGEIASFVTDSVNDVSSLKVTLTPQQDATPWIGTDHDTAPYLNRAMPTQSNAYNRESGVIVGGTVAWNQLVRNGNFANADGWISDYATLSVSDNMLTYTSTMASGSAAVLGNVLGTVNGHKYLVSADIKCNNTLPASGVWLGSGGHDGITRTVSELSKWTNISGVFVRGTGGNDRISLYPRSTLWNNGDTCNIRNIVCFDLTAMFGTTIADYIYSLEQATAGAGVAWFKKLFPNNYYEYNAGELLSVEGLESHDTVGFNAWDEEWELGALSATGGNATSSTEIRSKNYIPVVGGQTYYLYCAVASTFNYKFYDADKNFISGAYIGRNNTLLIPNDARYMRFYMGAAYGTTYNHDICINISKTTGTPKNGNYVSYEKHSYPLDSDLVLRGIPKLDASNNLYYDGDTYESDGTVTRKYGIVDLGTLNWARGSNDIMYATFAGLKYVTDNVVVNAICPKYTAVTKYAFGTGVDKTFRSDNSASILYFKDSAYTDVATFKAAMSGVYLVYELATPTTETAQPYTNPQVVDPDGTEEYVTANNVPVGHDSTYALVCPISGYDEVDVEHTGFNIWDEEWENKKGYSTGVMLDSSSNIASKNFIPVVSGTDYYLKLPSGVLVYLYGYDADRNYIGLLTLSNGVFNTGTAVYMKFATRNDTIATYNNDISINYPSTDHEYHAYQGQTYTADLPQTVYGGTVDLVSGVLTVTHGYVDLGTLNWLKYSVLQGTLFRSDVISDANIPYNSTEFICSNYETVMAEARLNGTISSSVANRVDIIDNAYSDATSFKTAMNGVQLVYELAAPQTYQLTPQQIQTLIGQNNVWSEQGDVAVTYNIPITNLLVKRQDVADVSGTWLTLHSQPVTQASDMDFTFIDFTNQYGKTYKYALVPLLTQTQSGVEVEVEGGYTVSDEVQSVFDGVFIVDSTGSQKCKANVGYGNVNMNQSVGSITPIGSQYPIIVTNSNNRYHNGSISGMIVPDDYYYNGNLSRIDMVNKRNELEQFLTNKRAKIIKDWNSNIWLVMIMDNIDFSFDNNYGMGMVTFNANWLEVGDPTNQEDLQATGLIDVGGV